MSHDNSRPFNSRIDFELSQQETKADLEKLWEHARASGLEFAAYSAIEPGPLPVKGIPIKQVRQDFILKLIRAAFLDGAEAGYRYGWVTGKES